MTNVIFAVGKIRWNPAMSSSSCRAIQLFCVILTLSCWYKVEKDSYSSNYQIILYMAQMILGLEHCYLIIIMTHVWPDSKIFIGTAGSRNVILMSNLRHLQWTVKLLSKNLLGNDGGTKRSCTVLSCCIFNVSYFRNIPLVYC